MKKPELKSFLDWIDEVYPEMGVERCTDGMYFLTVAGVDGPSVDENGIEVDGEDMWDLPARQLEVFAEDILSNAPVDLSKEAEEIKRVANTIREKLLPTATKVEPDWFVGEYPNGLQYVMVPFTEKYIDKINTIVEEYYDSIVDEDYGPDTDRVPAERMSWREWLEEN